MEDGLTENDNAETITEYRVVGPPGCGKTTWLGAQVEDAVASGRKVLISSLTKAAATEIAGRGLPIHFDSLGTLHSHCYHALGKPDIAESREYVEQWNEEEPDYRMSLGANDLGERIDGDNLEPTRETNGDDLMTQYQILRARMETDRMPESVAEFVQRWAAWKERNALLDFTDLIETCLLEVSKAPGDPDLMFVDEAQDLDLLEMSLIRKWGARARALHIVGDPDQAIFSWRGADPGAFTASVIPEENRQVLAQSYRVPVAVHAQAVRWISRIEGREQVEYRPRDHEGEVKSITATWKNPAPAVADADRYLAEGKSVMFLATCSYMLQNLIGALRETGTPFHNPYRRRNGAWNPLQKRRGQTSTADRVLAFLGIQEKGMWSAEDIIHWTDMTKVKGVLQTKGRGAVRNLTNGKDGEVSWDDIIPALTEEAVEAGLQGDLDWFEANLTAAKRNAAKFPLAIARNRGAEQLIRTPQANIGTVHCSPPDEPVLTTTGWVPIGDLNPEWHKIASHNRSTNAMTWGGTNNPGTDGFIFKKSARPYKGDLVILESETTRTRVTPNHRVPAMFNQKFAEKWCVYLMRKGDWWRIGVCTTAHTPYRSGGVAGRLATEQADAGWILEVHETREEAIIAEATWQARYGIPGLTFRTSNQRKLSNKDLAEIHEATSGFIQDRVDHLFSETHLQRDMPLYTRSSPKQQEVRKHNMRATFTTPAGNLLPLSEYISLIAPQQSFVERGHGKKWQRTVPQQASVTTEPFEGTVYGLDVPPFHHYVSGGAVVHNSVKGAEADVVYVFPDVSRAGMAEWIGNSAQRAGVYRLFYVAMTRARETLVLCAPGDKYAVNLNASMK